ncbi:MAG: MBL fold metallo-hydrolase [Bacillota bacterium]|nr:MBL fold metallo-hydrolase [Bacillota bacterium]
MEYRCERVCPAVHAFAVWDSSWGSYNNCYLVDRGRGSILVDTGKAEHGDALLRALARVGKRPEDITAVVLTHGHRDHAGAAGLFAAPKLMHAADLFFLPGEVREGFTAGLPDRGRVLGWECVLLGHHTPGSVALFDPESRVLFCGDHLCFFGQPFAAGALVDEGEPLRQWAAAFVSEWARNTTWRQDCGFDLYLTCLERLAKFAAEFLCTGHGGVLRGEIPRFLSGLALLGREQGG